MLETVTKTGKRRATASLLAGPRYEVMPLRGVGDEVAALPSGATVTVTSSPTKGLEATLTLAEQLTTLGVHVVPHLAARQIADRNELAETLDRIGESGMSEVFVVGGDNTEPAGVFTDGLGLLRAMDELGKRPTRVGIPAYPDGHHLIPEAQLASALAAKQSYADYIVTQLCFDADKVCRYVETARSNGIRLPIIAGIPGSVDTRKLLRIGMRIGVGDSMRFVRGHRTVAGKLLRPGGYRPDGLVRKLGKQGAVAGLHIYTFNEVGATVHWLNEAHRRAA